MACLTEAPPIVKTAQPGHACHRRRVFADRSDVHVTHVPSSVGVPMAVIAGH